ncbi:MAG: DUF3857 domain-containing protein [Akkermansiaceae bacterium]|nr:DUF3857 domain-containing protein [Akkermansiaceae bacterium]
MKRILGLMCLLTISSPAQGIAGGGNQVPPSLNDPGSGSTAVARRLFEGMDRNEARDMVNRMAAGKVEWREANIRFELGKSWFHIPDSPSSPFRRIYVLSPGNLALICVFFPQVHGTEMSAEAYLKERFSSLDPRIKSSRQVKAEGPAAELGMTVHEVMTSAGSSRSEIVISTLTKNGGCYNFMVTGEDFFDTRWEMSKFLKTLSWIDPEKDVSVPPLEELALPFAGFRVSCGDTGFSAVASEFPFSAAAMQLDQRFSIVALDMKGCEMPLRDAAESALANLSLTRGQPHETKEIDWGGKKGLSITSKEPGLLLERPMDWSMTCAMHEGFFCFTLGYWQAGDTNLAKTMARIIGTAEFGRVEGKTPDPTGDTERVLAGYFYNELGLKAYDRGNYRIASKAFGQAVGFVPADPVVAANQVNSLTQQGRLKTALDAVVEARERHPEHQDLKSWHACLLARLDRAAEADSAFQELFEDGYRDREPMLLWIGALQKSGKNGRASDIAQKLVEESGDVSWQRVLANSLWKEGKLSEAISEYEELSKELCEEADFAVDHVSLLVEANEPKRAIELVVEWEKTRDAPLAMLFSKGLAQSALGWHKDAVATFSRVDEMSPGNQTVQETLAHARAMLGHGSREGLRDDLEACVIPEMLRARSEEALKESDIAADYEGEGWVNLEDIRVWSWAEGEDARLTHRQRIKVLDDSGVAGFSTLYVGFKPTSERVNIHKMVVTSPGGDVLESFRREEVYVRDANTGLADGAKLVCLPVPTLKPGAVIEFEYTKSQLATSDRFPMTVTGIPADSGTVYGAVAFTGDIGKIRIAATERLRSLEGEGFHAYEARLIHRDRGAGYLPNYDRWGMMCWAVDSRTTWESDTREYLDEIKDHLADDGYAAGVVEELGLKDQTDKEICRTVVRWLNDRFQYQGIEFGRRARIPAKGGDTLTRGYGDCKDLSLMTRGILREAGIDSRLALVNTSGVVRTDVPGIDQFDHMVLYLPGMGGAILDPTLREFNTPEALSQSMLGSQAWVVEGEAPAFITMEEPKEIQRSVVVGRTVRVDPDTGDGRIEESVTISPAQAGYMRLLLSSTAGSEQSKMFEAMMRRREARLELERFETSGLEDPFADLTLRYRYLIPGMFQTDGDSLSGAVPPIMERLLCELALDRDRTLGFVIRAEEQCTTSNLFSIPAGYSWVAPDNRRETMDEDGSMKGSLEWSGDATMARVDSTMKLLRCKGDANSYQKLRSANHRLLQALGKRVNFRRP